MTADTWTPHLAPCRPTPPSWGGHTPHLCAGQTLGLNAACGRFNLQSSFAFGLLLRYSRVICFLEERQKPGSWCVSTHHVTESLQSNFGQPRYRMNYLLPLLLVDFRRCIFIDMRKCQVLSQFSSTHLMEQTGRRMDAIGRARHQSSGLESLTAPLNDLSLWAQAKHFTPVYQVWHDIHPFLFSYSGLYQVDWSQLLLNLFICKPDIKSLNFTSHKYGKF